MRNLNVKEVLNAKPGRHSDGGGLILDVKPSGRAYWVVRYTTSAPPTKAKNKGKTGLRWRRDMVIGLADRGGKGTGAAGADAAEQGRPVLSLAQARARAAQIVAASKDGSGPDPVAARMEKRGKAAAQPEADAAPEDRTFRGMAETLIAWKGKTVWKGGTESKHGQQWTATLSAFAYPVIGDRHLADITDDDIRTILVPVHERTPETASRLRGRIAEVIDVGIAKGWRTAVNPASLLRLQALKVVPTTRPEAKGQPALPQRQVPAFVHELRQKEGVSARAVLFAILTAARSGEVRGMRWREVRTVHLDELGRDAVVWHVPAERMKAKRPHRVPLSAPALAILEEMRAFGDAPDALVFPGKRSGAMLSDMALSMLVRGMCMDGLKEGEPPRWHDAEGRAIVPHGFRSSFKEYCRKGKLADELSELALAHADRNKVRKSYAREDLLEQRVAVMEAWGEHVMRGPGEVAKLGDRRTA
jgi:integrase